MTCIVGYIDRKDKKICIGADSISVSKNDKRVRNDPKVFEKDGFITGFSGSFRLGQLLMSIDFKPPTILGFDEHLSGFNYMVSYFIPAIKKTFNKNDFKMEGALMVGSSFGLYVIHSDYQVCEYVEPYAAIGCGAPYALGALSTISKLQCTSINEKIGMTLQIASKYSLVEPPFIIKSINI